MIPDELNPADLVHRLGNLLETRPETQVAELTIRIDQENEPDFALVKVKLDETEVGVLVPRVSISCSPNSGIALSRMILTILEELPSLHSDSKPQPVPPSKAWLTIQEMANCLAEHPVTIDGKETILLAETRAQIASTIAEASRRKARAQ